jgi:hypothetical protein
VAQTAPETEGNSMNRQLAPALAIILLAATAPTLAAINGTALAIKDGHIFKYTMPANTWDTVISKTDFNNYNTLAGPCFSPDGRQVAYTRYQLNTGAQDGAHILVADNDGNNITEMCQSFRGTYSNIYCSWAGNGYIYWSEDDDRVMRVNIQTKAREIVTNLAAFTGPKPTENRIDNLKVSLDATHGAFMINGVGWCIGLDFATMVSHDYGSGCQGTVSPNGRFVTHSVFGGGWDYHQRGYIQDFATGAVADSFFAPGAVQGQSAPKPRFVDIRFSHSADSVIVWRGEDALDGSGYVHNLSSNETVLVGNCQPVDFWCGALPFPPAAAPRIALDSSALHFSSLNGSTPAAKVVHVSNSGIGTLTNVSPQGNPAWLTVVRAGSGNSQTLTNTVNPASLAAGVYNATITVSGGGSTTSANYAVSFNVARSVLAPSGLTVSGQGNNAARLAWADNSDNESGFSVERASGVQAWLRLTTLGANVVAYTDSGLALQTTYHYRVRAFGGTDSSGYSNVDSVRFEPLRTVTITSPVAGDRWTAGSTVHIRWTTQNVALVDMYYSVDGGDQFVMIPDSSIRSGSALWGDYPWVVPNLAYDSILIMIQEYSNRGVSDMSPNVALVPRSATLLLRRAALPERTALLDALASTSGGVGFDYAVARAGQATLRIYGIDGRQVAVLALSGEPGYHHAAWISPGFARRAGTPATYLARLEVGGRVADTRAFVLRR